MVRTAALRLFASEGYAAVSMRQIAGQVGLQAGALYSYTRDKQSLLTDLMRDVLDARETALQAEALPSAEPVAALQAFCNAHLTFHLAHEQASDLLRLEMRNLPPETRTEIDAYQARYRATLQGILEAGAQQKLFATPQVDLAATAVLGLLDAAVVWARDATLPPERHARIVWNMVRRAVGARGAQ